MKIGVMSPVPLADTPEVVGVWGTSDADDVSAFFFEYLPNII